MKNLFTLYIFLTGLYLIPFQNYAQEPAPLEVEDSAEFFLEEYTDEFQENFFEALKQKGIENYDKAINLLLECKRLGMESTVVDHELANVYLADKQYVLAKEYGLEAIQADPSNYWYLNTLVQIVKKQGANPEDLVRELPYDNQKLKENLALIHFKNKHYELALSTLKDAQKSGFSKRLALKIKDSLNHVEEPQVKTEDVEVSKASPLEEFRNQLDNQILKGDFAGLLKTSTEALENFPAQPYFYYANGLALNKTSKTNQAIEVLESALDYLLDDASLADKIYRELAAAYTTLGNASKANMYLSKIKSGS
ncbi:MAG: tetratricopeptide repeat protein [Flavobacteriaceae bacterium]